MFNIFEYTFTPNSWMDPPSKPVVKKIMGYPARSDEELAMPENVRPFQPG
jgi:hypothetical protein